MVKKGLSSVITTILIILITVAAIAIIWTSVLPMVKTSTSLSCTDVDLSIGTEGYTCYSPNNLTAVQVKKGPNSVNVTGVTISLSSSGNTVSYSTDYNFQPNTQKTFYLNSSSLNSIDKIGLVAIYSKDKTKLECPSVYMENARTKTCDLSSVQIRRGHGNWVASDNVLVQQNGVCIPDCSSAGDYNLGQNFSDGCGGNCAGTLCVPNCSNSSSYLIGQNFSDGCGGNCTGTKDICDGTSAVGTACSDGTVYVNSMLRTTPNDAGSYVWEPIGVTTGATNSSDGRNNIITLKLSSSDLSAYPAAKACEDSTTNGKDDWYLPAKDELNTLYVNRVAIGNFDTSGNWPGSYYWSSTEQLVDSRLAWVQRFNDGWQGSFSTKSVTYSVRCVRRVS